MLHRKICDHDGSITEAVIWQLPAATDERPHGLKYRLYHGNAAGQCLVRYDNEHGRGDHKHLGEEVVNYRFKSVECLMNDFQKDIQKMKRKIAEEVT